MTSSPTRRTRLGLRSRAAVAFAAIGLVVAVGLAATTQIVATRYLVAQRERAATSQTYANARLARSALRAENVEASDLMASLGGGGSSPILRYRDKWYSSSLGVDRDIVNPSLMAIVDEDHAGHQRVRGPDGAVRLVVGVPMPAVDAAYFEVFSLEELERTLDTLRSSLVVGALVAAIAAAVLGRYAAGRIVRPLQPIAAAAEQIATGDLHTRLTSGDDRDLSALTDAFNSMAASLQARVERDARFAADVSHELRSPLAVLSASLEVIGRRRDGLDPTVRDAFDLLVERVASFQVLVLELLEMSRFDNHAMTLEPEPVDLRRFVVEVLQERGSEADVHVDPSVPALAMVDRRRLAQAVVNIVDNARRYAGGVTGVSVTTEREEIVIDIDDDGPGVALEERAAIFDRFARGTVGRRTGSSSGTGLGLALAAEHVKLHRGRIEVHAAPVGARFRIRIPLVLP